MVRCGKTWILIFVIIANSVSAQKQAYVWQFGNYLGLDFNFSPPRLLQNGKISCADDTEPTSSISDKNGKLLFYTNGINVWNRDHNIMPNGNNLLGDCSTTQTLIVPNPGNPNLYYIFTASIQGDDPQVPLENKGFHYSTIDISLDSERGDVAKKNVLLVKSTTEKIAATLHANQKDVWVIMHEWNNNIFNAFLVTAGGVDSRKISTAAGSIHGTQLNQNNRFNAIGQMKFSSNGERLALVLSEDKVAEIFSFDSSTGEIKFESSFKESNNERFYGIEFSPNNQFVYISNTGKSIYQYDLTSNQALLLPNDATFDSSGQLQLGPDGKIYVAKFNQYYLGIISDPDAKGASCNYKSQGIILQVDGIHYSKGGLPNFISSYLYNPLVTELPPFLEMPNVITPNGDNLNDEFVPSKFYNVSHIELSIFNRWGQLILKNQNVETGWDGGGYPSGPYYWHAEYLGNNGRNYTKKGIVNIIR